MRTPQELVRLPKRALALLLAFGALVLLLVGTAATTQAFVAKTGHTTLDDFAAGEFHRTALLDLPLEGIDSVQLVPVGLFGTWKQDAQQLPVPVTELSVVAGGGNIVVMGGSDTTFMPRDEVYVSRIGSGGPLSPWVEQTQTPCPNRCPLRRPPSLPVLLGRPTSICWAASVWAIHSIPCTIRR